jgi:DnaA family protein
MTEQLVFELAPPEPPAFANFVTGRNAEALAALAALGAGHGREPGVVLWGAGGVGKTHLLRATVAAAAAAGREAVYAAEPGALVSDPQVLARSALVAVDRVEAAGADAQARLFTLYNALRAAGGALLVAADAAPVRLPLRDDLRSRLGWGLVFEILPLADEEKPAALVAWARLRGLALSDDVVAYLLAHGRRDMASLLATLTALDRHSLATRRAITVPLVRDWLQRDIGFTARPD